MDDQKSSTTSNVSPTNADALRSMADVRLPKQIGDDSSGQKSSIRNDVSSTHLDALRIIAEVCQPKQHGDDSNRQNNIECSEVVESLRYKILSDPRSQNESAESGHNSKEMIASKPLSVTVDVVEINDDNEVSMDSSSPRNPGLLNWNTGEVQNVENNTNTGVQDLSAIVDKEVHAIPSKGYAKTTSQTTSSPTATILDVATFPDSQSPCIVPVGSSEYVEYDAV